MGIPFLILTWYMFIRLCRELVNKDLGSGFNLTYFLLQSLLFLAYGFIIIRIYRFGESRFDLIKKTLIIAYSIINVAVLSASLFQFLYHNRKLIDGKTRSANRIFGYQYLLFFLVTNALLILSPLSPYLGIIFIFILFASHLIPVFFLSIHLDKNFVEPEVINNIEQHLRDFAEKFGISKREKEIIQLICQGKSNQDISDSLYISLQTVKDHIYRIYLKTGVKNRVQLTNLIRS